MRKNKNIKTYEDFINEEINWKGLAAGAMSFLATACSNFEVYDKSGNEVNVTNDYKSDGKVDDVEEVVSTQNVQIGDVTTSYENHICYKYTIFDNNGNIVIVELDSDVISVGDSVSISIDNGGDAEIIMKEEDCKDPSKCFPLPHNHIKGDSRKNPEVSESLFSSNDDEILIKKAIDGLKDGSIKFRETGAKRFSKRLYYLYHFDFAGFHFVVEQKVDNNILNRKIDVYKQANGERAILININDFLKRKLINILDKENYK